MYESLLALRQEGTIQDYRLQFETMATPLSGVSEHILEGSFINGLRLEIQAELCMLQPFGLGRTMSLAQRIECEVEIEQKHC